MFRRDPASAESVDVNDFIVAQDLGEGLSVRSSLGARPKMDISNEEIIEADIAPPEPPRKQNRSRILILAVTGLFAAGGVASIFAPTDRPVSLAKAVEEPEERPQIQLPPGLAMPSMASDTTPSPMPVALPGAEISPAPSTDEPRATTMVTAPAEPGGSTVPPPSQTPLGVHTPPGLAPTQPPAAVPAPAASVPTAAPNPIAAQIAEAERSTPAIVGSAGAAPAPVQPTASSTGSTLAPIAGKPAATDDAQPKPAAAVDRSSPAASKPATSVPAKPPVANTKPQTPVASKTAVPAQPTATKGTAPVAAKAPAPVITEPGTPEDSVKRLVTMSAEAFGLQSMQEGIVTVERRGNGSQRLHVGDRLPSGEQIIKIDARSLTLVTDRSVIRFTN